MSEKALPWFRMYSEAVDDAKLKLIAPSDRWYFVALLCCKCQGLLDESDVDPLRDRKVAVKLDLTLAELEELKRRLVEVGLTDGDLQPKAWASRQFRTSDRSKPGVADLGDYKGYVYFIGPKDGHVKIGYSKNPWARVKEFQTGTPDELHVLATVKTHEISERTVHELFESERVTGEWFKRSGGVAAALDGLSKKKIKTHDDLLKYVELLRDNYVATTTDTDTDTDKEKNNRSSATPPDRFADFWAAYPKKVKKQDARKVWKSRKLNAKADDLIADVKKRQAKDGRWLEGFVPDPTTYLRGSRWEDELEPPRVNGSAKPDWQQIPRGDDDLWPWAKKHGYPNPGTMNYFQYRQALQRAVEQRLQGRAA